MRVAGLSARVAVVLGVAVVASACGGTQGAATGASDLVPASAPVFVSHPRMVRQRIRAEQGIAKLPA